MRGAARGIPIVMLIAILIALALPALRLGDVDPRGRASWAAVPLTIDTTPQDIALFLPACEVRAIAVHPTHEASGGLAADFLAPRADGSSHLVGSASAAANGGKAILLPLDASQSPWRAPLIVRLRALEQPIVLAGRRPITVEPGSMSRLGTLACLSGAGDLRAGWLVLASLVLIASATVALGVAWLRRALGNDVSFGWKTPTALVTAVAMTAITLLTYAVVVPPFEPADELAHFQYARFVATTGALPREVPAPDSEWRASSYEFVQQPLYYVGAAALLNATGLASPRPQLTLNPRSRARPGGTEPTLFEHGRPTANSPHRGLVLLRVVSLLFAVATTLLIARLVMQVTGDPLIIVTVAGGLSLIPQWCSVMGSVSTDPPATLLAAAATFGLVRLTHLHDATTATRDRWCLATGLLIGAAYATKATTVFLVPMAVLACVLAAAWRGRVIGATRLTVGLRRALPASLRPLLLIGAGALLTGGWVLVRAWLVFGDPQAFAFKKAILEAGGFVPIAGPMPWTGEFWSQMRVMTFEPFWARFGSLGAGPFPGSKVWLIYGAASIALVLVAVLGAAGWIRTGIRAVRDGADSPGACTLLAVAVCALGVGVGLIAWVAVNLAPRADMVVHWTPRHIMPMTAPAALLVAAGLDWLTRAPRLLRLAAAAAVGLLLPALAVAWVGVLRATILMFHFGY